MKIALTPAVMLALVGCTQPQTMPESTSLPFFGDGYPGPGDPCRRLGETAQTNQWLDDARDLIACPDGPEAQAMAAQQNAQVVDRIDGHTILSMGRR